MRSWRYCLPWCGACLAAFPPNAPEPTAPCSVRSLLCAPWLEERLGRVFGEPRYRNEAVMDGVDREQVFLQGDDSQNRLGAGRCEHHNRGLLAAPLESDLNPRHGIALFAAIGQLEQ